MASGITSANVSTLGVAWTVPLTMNTTHTDGAYATTPVIVNGVVYTQDLNSDVFAISLATGKVLWTHNYDSANGGPDGVNVVGGVVYAATAMAAVALDAATGARCGAGRWSPTTTRASPWRPATTTAPSTCPPCRPTCIRCTAPAARGSCGR